MVIVCDYTQEFVGCPNPLMIDLQTIWTGLFFWELSRKNTNVSALTQKRCKCYIYIIYHNILALSGPCCFQPSFCLKSLSLCVRCFNTPMGVFETWLPHVTSIFDALKPHFHPFDKHVSIINDHVVSGNLYFGYNVSPNFRPRFATACCSRTMRPCKAAWIFSAAAWNLPVDRLDPTVLSQNKVQESNQKNGTVKLPFSYIVWK